MLLALTLLSCASSSSSADTAAVLPTDDCAVTWNGWASGFFVTYCDSCHAAESPDRRGAPEAATFDTEAEALGWADRISARVLDEETMPVGGGVYPDDLDRLARWLSCAP